MVLFHGESCESGSSGDADGGKFAEFDCLLRIRHCTNDVRMNSQALWCFNHKNKKTRQRNRSDHTSVTVQRGVYYPPTACENAPDRSTSCKVENLNAHADM